MRIAQGHNASIQVSLERQDTDIDITSRVLSADIQTGDVSNVGTRATGIDGAATLLRLVLDGEASDDAPDLSPANLRSPMNDPSVLLKPYRRVTVRAGEGSQLQRVVFSGFLGASVTVDTAHMSRSITVTAQDLTKPLRDYFITGEVDLAPTNSTIDQVVSNAISLLPAELRPALTVVGTPAFAVTNYTVGEVSLWEALNRLVAAVGWWLGAVGDELVLMTPPRNSLVSDFEVDFDDGLEDNVSITDEHIRNEVTVTWPGGSVTKTNQDSINEWSGGLTRAAKIGRESDEEPGPANQQQAEELADMFLADLAEPAANARVVLPFQPLITVFSRIGFNNPQFGDTPRLVSVASVQHTFEAGGRSRTIVLGSSTTGASWGRRRARTP